MARTTREEYQDLCQLLVEVQQAVAQLGVAAGRVMTWLAAHQDPNDESVADLSLPPAATRLVESLMDERLIGWLKDQQQHPIQLDDLRMGPRS